MSNKKGFTLVEIIITMAILALFMTSLVTVFRNSLNAWKKSEARLAVYQNARLVLEQISREVAYAVSDEACGIMFLGLEEGSGKNSSKDELYFVSPLENSGRWDLCAVGYWLDEEDNELLRYYRVDTDDDPLELDFDGLSAGEVDE